MTTSIRAQIGQAIATRLATVTAANGYDHDVKAVYYDTIPMGLELDSHQLPAIFLLDEGAAFQHQHQIVDVARAFRLQLVHEDATSDTVMDELIRAVMKALWANSPTAQRQDEFRTLHTKVYRLEMLDDETDLHMIEGQRFATVRFVVYYRTHPYDL